MIETLLTLFVLTIGVLGVAGLQMQGMRSGGMAMQRMVVLMKTQEIIERMRVNRDSIASYAGAATDHNCDSGSICSGAQQAENDLYLWQQDLTNLLPSLTSAPIVVTPPAVANLPSTVDITINWTDRGDALSYNVQVQI